MGSRRRGAGACVAREALVRVAVVAHESLVAKALVCGGRTKRSCRARHFVSRRTNVDGSALRRRYIGTLDAAGLR